MLAELLANVESDGRGALVLVSGEAGVGKTALLRQFCDHHADGVQIFRGACDPLFTPEPLGPLLDIADGLGGDFATRSGGRALHELVGALTRTLATRRPAVLAVEDVHWADEATLDVLRVLIRRIEKVAALVVLTFRDDELDWSHPLRRTLGELATQRSVTRLKLAPLSPEASRSSRAARRRRRRALPDDRRESVLRRRGARQRRTIRSRRRFAKPCLRGARDCLRRRGPCSRPWRSSRRRRSSGCSRRSSVGPPTIWRIASPRACSVGAGRNRVSPRARAARRRGVGRPRPRARDPSPALAALADPPDGAADLARLAHHAEAARDAEAVLSYAPAAAEHAEAVGAHREAAAQYARAFRFADRLPPGERAELLEHQAEACYLTDQYDEGSPHSSARWRSTEPSGTGSRGRRARPPLELPLCARAGPTEAERASTRSGFAAGGTSTPGASPRRRTPCSPSAATAGAEAPKGPSGPRARRACRRVGDEPIAVNALLVSQPTRRSNGRSGGTCEPRLGGADDPRRRQPCFECRYREAGRLDPGRARLLRGAGARAFQLYLLALRARLELDQGLWARQPNGRDRARGSIARRPSPRSGHLRSRPRAGSPRRPGMVGATRRGRSPRRPTGELGRIGPVAAAKAETRGSPATSTESPTQRTRFFRSRAISASRESSVSSEAGVGWPVSMRRPVLLPEPYRLQLGGRMVGGRDGNGQTSAVSTGQHRARATGDEHELLRALDELRGLDALPAAAIVARRLRERGFRGLPRGPRPSTREQPRQPHRARARGARPARPEPRQRRDRRSPRPLPTHGRTPRFGDPAQALRAHPRTGGHRGRPSGLVGDGSQIR